MFLYTVILSSYSPMWHAIAPVPPWTSSNDFLNAKLIRTRFSWETIPTTANRKQNEPQKEQHTQLQHPLLQDTVQTYVILPPDHTWMEQPALGNSGSQVPGLFQVQACCPPVTTTDHPLPFLLFLVSTTLLYYATHPFTIFQKCLVLQHPQLSIIITTLMMADQ